MGFWCPLCPAWMLLFKGPCVALRGPPAPAARCLPFFLLQPAPSCYPSPVTRGVASRPVICAIVPPSVLRALADSCPWPHRRPRPRQGQGFRFSLSSESLIHRLFSSEKPLFFKILALHWLLGIPQRPNMC